jgi:alpha-galactosidase
MKFPLIIGADMRKLTKKQIAVLQNPEMIALNQDPLGIPGDLIWKEGAEEVVPGKPNDSLSALLIYINHLRPVDQGTRITPIHQKNLQ